MFGAIEAGGTKFLCGVGDSVDQLDIVQIPTTTPVETLTQVAAFFRGKPIAGLGLACFGPVDLHHNSPTYGHITTTPKVAWRNFDIVHWLERELGVHVTIETDVNAAAYAEQQRGAAQGATNVVYFTVGTGIGGGAICNGQLIHGSAHPEMGHLLVRPHPQDHFAGVCPYHGACLEGVASGPALAARWGTSPTNLPPGHPAWEMEAFYLAQACVNAAMVLSPEIIVFGGGVSKAAGLVARIETEMNRQLNGYLKKPPRIVPTALEAAGLVGAWLLVEW